MSYLRPDRDEQHLPKQDEEEEHSEERQQIDPEGHPIRQEITMTELTHGVDMWDEHPIDAHTEDHPTPDRPSGRIP
jgi:hypothetical protein